MADEEADVGSMSDSTILVMVRSLFTGRKFFTFEIRFSKPPERALVPKRSWMRLDMELKPRKRSPVAEGAAGWLGAEVIIVIFVISRTLHVLFSHRNWKNKMYKRKE